ncbi:MAG: oligosaccharide flippase family protein, partial [Acidimicrobiales bacterium]
VLVASVSDAIAAVLQGLDRMGAMSVAIVLGRVVFVAGAVGLLLLGFGVYAVAAIATVGFVSTLALQVVLLQRVRREYGDTGRLSFDRGDLLDLGQQSMPYFWIALSIVVYQQVDTIIISLVVDGDEVLGWYSVYERLAGTLMFVPTVFVVAIFPALARLYGDPELDMSSGGLSGRMIRKAVSTMLLVSVPLGFGAAVVAGPLVELLYGDDFADAAPVVSVGGVVLSLTYLTTVLGTFLIAMDKQRQWTRFIVLGGVLTVPLDLALVPAFETGWNNGALGAVLGYLVTESIVLAGAIYLLPAGSLDRASLWFAVRVVVAGIVMALVVHSLGSVMLPARVAIGAVVYAVMVGLLGLISTEDRQLIRTQLRTRRPSS